MHKREFAVRKKRQAFDAILRFMTRDDITLSAEEERILNRWIYCDSLMRSKQYTDEQIIQKMIDAYQVSVFTANNDINYAQDLFAKSRRLNKKYLIHHHLQRIDEDLERIRKSLFKVIKGEDGAPDYYPSIDAKEMAALAKLHETYTYTLNSIPEELQKSILPPPIFQFLLAPGQVITRPMSTEEAMAKADILLKENKDGVFTSETDEDEE